MKKILLIVGALCAISPLAVNASNLVTVPPPVSGVGVGGVNPEAVFTPAIGVPMTSPTDFDQLGAFDAPMVHEDSYDVFVYAVAGPLKSNPAYQPWADPLVWKMYTNGLSGLDSDDLGHTLATTNIAQPEDLSDTNALWCAVKIRAKHSGTKLSLNMLRFSEMSSDPSDSLGNLYDLTTMNNLVYTPRAIGVIWDPAGPGVNDTIIDNNLTSGNTLVDEIDFIGMQSPSYVYSSGFPYSSVDNYIHHVISNYLLTIRCEVVGSDGTVLAMGQKTLQANGSAFVPTLHTSVDENGVYIYGDMQDNTTLRLYSAPSLSGPWNLDCTFNPMDTILRPNDGQGFFKGRLE